MKLLKIIKDADTADETQMTIREGVRAVLFDENGLVPLLFVSKFNYHKLPGGGIEAGENRMDALSRECLEEVGCEIEVTDEIGQIIEYRSAWNLKQTNYCYTGKVISLGPTSFTQKEIDQGFQIVWMTLDQAIDQIMQDQPECYEGIFIQKRELTFLQNFPRPKTKSRVGEEGPTANSQHRRMIRPGSKVLIVLKKDQPTGKLTEGTVQDILTNKLNHPRGIKVRLTTGQVGRVQEIL